MRFYSVAMCLLLWLTSVPLWAADTAQSVANQMKKQLAAAADTARGVTILRTGSVTSNGKVQDLNVTVHWKAGMMRCDEITGPLPAMTALDSLELARQDSIFKANRGKRVNGEARDRRAPQAPRAVESRILVKSGRTGWTVISPRNKLPSAEFGWNDIAMSNWISPDDISSGKLTGTERVRGRDCWVINGQRGESLFDQLWIDKESFQIVRALKKTKRSDYRLECSDFRAVEGLTALPFKSELFVNGEPTISLVTTQATAGVQLWDGLFDPANIELPAGHNKKNQQGGAR